MLATTWAALTSKAARILAPIVATPPAMAMASRVEADTGVWQHISPSVAVAIIMALITIYVLVTNRSSEHGGLKATVRAHGKDITAMKDDQREDTQRIYDKLDEKFSAIERAQADRHRRVRATLDHIDKRTIRIEANCPACVVQPPEPEEDDEPDGG